jgi:hypothetical protein
MNLKAVVAGALLLCSSALGQTKKTRPFVPPDVNSYLFDFYIAKDQGCAKDYARTVGKEGLELRKMLAELEGFGCIDHITGSVFTARVIGTRSFGDEKNPIKMSRVIVGVTASTYQTPKGGFPTGFVLDRDLYTRAEVNAIINKRK